MKNSFPRRNRLAAFACFVLLAGVFQASAGHAQSFTSLAIAPAQPTVNIGGTTQLTATATYSDGSSNNVSSSVAWSSADPRVVNISSSGVASGSANRKPSLSPPAIKGKLPPPRYPAPWAISNGAVL